VQECKTLGINPLNCNAPTILNKKRCILSTLPDPTCYSTAAKLQNYSNAAILLPIGAVIAFGAAIMAVRKLSIIRPKKLVSKAPLLYFGLSIAFFGIAVLAYNTAFGNDCWGTQIIYS
jgi:hypothetical protein